TLGEAAAAKTATGAQAGLNAALLACPITWIILAVVALIAIFYAAVAAVNHFAGTSYSATGLIAGSFLTMAALVGNAGIGLFNGLIQFFWTLFAYPVLGGIEWLLNAANGGFDSFGGAVANLIGNIIGWFLSLGQVVTTIIDAIFGTSWTAGLEALKNDVTAWGKNENAITLDRTAPAVDYRFSYGDAFRTGNEFGQGVEDKVKGLFDFSAMDPMGAGGDPFAFGDTLEDIYGSAADTAANTAAAADALDFAEEDLAYLRDIAEREAINRFTTAQIKIEQHNENHISSDTDLDGIMDAWASDFAQKLDISTEGVHA
ncbi:MAG: phage tail tape measure protein, partial [Candidatus Faecalibacterium intestinavium]|nr:phage tail tape measure protein [Candidatus Faecalibacterium intestinavium]